MKTLKKIGSFSLAKVLGIFMAVVGLIVGLVFAGIFITAGISHYKNTTLGAGIILGILFLILAPVLYGIIGFIAGALSALVYNLLARLVGGIGITIE